VCVTARSGRHIHTSSERGELPPAADAPVNGMLARSHGLMPWSVCVLRWFSGCLGRRQKAALRTLQRCLRVRDYFGISTFEVGVLADISTPMLGTAGTVI